MQRLLLWVWGSALLATVACGNTRIEREPEADSGQSPDGNPTPGAGGTRSDGDMTPDGDPPGPPSQASLYFVIGAPGVAGPGCAVGNYVANIGGPPRSSAADPGTREIDGANFARIGCRVSGSTTFEVSGSAEKGATSFLLLGGTVASGGEGTGSISVAGPGTAGKQLTSVTDGCRLSVSRPPFQVASGNIWASFDCPTVTNPSNPGSTCSARGEFVFENCEQ